MTAIHTVRSTSHWQGASSYPVAIAPTHEIAEHVADLLSTCSFCRPGRAARYQTGDCYDAHSMRVRPDVPTLPDDAGLWTREDAFAWFQRMAG